MNVDPASCACHTARARSRAEGRYVKCEHCGALALEPAAPGAPVLRRVGTYHAEALPPPARALPGDPVPPPRAARRTTLTPEATELARVRTLLHALRPDYPSALHPLPPACTAPVAERIRDPMAGWGDVPRALESAPPPVDGPDCASAGADVLRRLDSLPDDAAAVLRWLREHAKLETLRGLYVDAGLAFADAAQSALWARDLTARRDGAHHLGRTLVLAAAAAWEGGEP
jgi:hypothetical protein